MTDKLRRDRYKLAGFFTAGVLLLGYAAAYFSFGTPLPAGSGQRANTTVRVFDERLYPTVFVPAAWIESKLTSGAVVLAERRFVREHDGLPVWKIEAVREITL